MGEGGVQDHPEDQESELKRRGVGEGGVQDHPEDQESELKRGGGGGGCPGPS